MKAIKIDVEKKKIYEVEISKDSNELASIYNHLECRTFEAPINLPKNDFVYVDEEGLLKSPAEVKGGFQMKGFSQPISGHGLVVGCNPSSGKSRDVRTTIEEIEEMVTFVPKEIIQSILLR